MRLLFPYLLFGVLTLIVVFDNVGGREARVATTVAETGLAEHDNGNLPATEAGLPDRSTRSDLTGEVPDNGATPVRRDPVCQMDVGDRLTASFGGTDFSFCTERCQELFLSDPELYIRETCPVCLADSDSRTPVTQQSPAFTWQDRTYRFCSDEHRSTFAADPAGYFIHTMWGIPSSLYAVSVGLILVLSFGLFELFARRRRRSPVEPKRVNLLHIPFAFTLLRWPPFRFLCQLIFVGLFLLIIIAGLFGNQIASLNIAPLLTWTIWWGGLVILIMFLGKAWCYVCPWDAIAGWIERLRFWGKAKDGLGLGLKWPKALRNITLATVLFVGLTWMELGFGITMNPQATAMLGLAMLSMTILAVLVFERRAFCRYACLVGRVSGLYSMFSATEVRAVDPEVCRSCATHDCYHGNEHGYGCPTGLLPGTLKQNTYCISCMECIKTCPSENMTVQARPWGSDLAVQTRHRKDEAYLCLLMLAITGFHGLTMTPVWGDMLSAFEGGLGLAHIPSFSLGMALIMLGPILVYAGLMKLTVLLSGTPEVRYGKAFIAFAYCLLPIALFYHLAHNLEHLLMEGQKVIPLASNPLGYVPGEPWSLLGFSGTGPWDLFGTRDFEIAPLVSLPTLWLLQVILVLVGHVFALWVSDRTARRLYPQPGRAFKSQLPMLVGMVLFSMFSLWLLKQPMEMRTSAM